MTTPPKPDPSSSAWADRPVTAARSGLLALVAFVPLAALLGQLLAGRDGALGAALGCLVPITVLVLTWAAAEIGSRRSASTFAGLMMGSFLVKMAAVALLLVALRGVDGLSRPAFGVAALVGLVLALVVEAWVVASTRAPYVEPDVTGGGSGGRRSPGW